MAKHKYEIRIWFQADERGKQCDFAEMKLRTKPVSLKQAKYIAITEAEKIWPHYEVEIEKLQSGFVGCSHYGEG